MAIDKEKRNARQQKWVTKQDRLNFVMPSGTKEKIQKAAYNKKISASEYVRQAISKALEEDGTPEDN